VITIARRIIQKALAKAKAKARRRAAARARRITTKDIMESLGMKRVKVDGKTWYE
jgi:membrane protein implicated in regulation of membrane protease activity